MFFRGIIARFQVLPIPSPTVIFKNNRFIINFNIPVKNNTAFSVPVTQVEGVILYQNRIPLANVFVDQSVTLKANTTTPIPVRAEIGVGTLIDAGVTIVSEKSFLPSFWFRGRAIAGQISIPVSQNIQVI